MYIFRQNGPTDGKIETMITVDSMFFVYIFIPVRLFMCDIQCIRWVPALSVVSVRYSGPL